MGVQWDAANRFGFVLANVLQTHLAVCDAPLRDRNWRFGTNSAVHSGETGARSHKRATLKREPDLHLPSIGSSATTIVATGIAPPDD
jgi:hypothetical protein